MTGGRRPRQDFGRWVRGEQIGSGGNAVVYQAVHSVDGTVGALKLLKRDRGPGSEPYERFLREVKFLQTKAVPGVLPLLDTNVSGNSASGIPWHVTPLAVSVRDALGTRPSLASVVAATHDFARTLAVLAEASIHHRDIKPANLFQLDGVGVIGDFGLVSLPDAAGLTANRGKVGPWGFLPNEVLDDPATANGERVDVFELAKSLWVLAARRRWPPQGAIDVAGRHALRRISDDPRAYRLEGLIEAATADDPAIRPTIAAFRDELRAWIQPNPAQGALPELDDLRRRLAAARAPAAAAQEALYARFRQMGPTLEALKGALDEINRADLGLDGGEYKPYNEPFQLWPKLAAAGAIESRGWLCTRWTAREGWFLLAWAGVQLLPDFRHHLAAALAAVPYGYAWQEDLRRDALVWHGVRDVVAAGPGEGLAIAEFHGAMLAAIPVALRRIAEAIGAA